MKVLPNQRFSLAEWLDVCEANGKLSDKGHSLPREALILDEDINDREFIRGLRSQQLTYADGRPGIVKFQRLQAIAAGHIFQSTDDPQLLAWCGLNDYPVITGNEEDFVGLHQNGFSHSGILVISDKDAFGQNPQAHADEVDRIISSLRKTKLRDNVVEVTI